MRAKIILFSPEALIDVATAAGLEPHVRIKKPTVAHKRRAAKVTIRLCMMPTCLAPSSVQQSIEFLRPIGIARSARPKWLLSIGTSGSVRCNR